VAEGGGPTSVWSLDEKAYAEAEKTVLLAALQGIVAQRIQRMQSRLLRQSRTGLPRVIRMPAKADDSADYRILTELNSTGRAVASCVADLGIVTPSPLYTGARLSGVSLTAMTFRSTPPIGSHCTLRIRHVGRAVILERPEHSPTPVPYFFQSGPDDDPVQWSFTWTSGADEKGVLTPDTDDLRSSGLLGDILSQLMPRTDGGGKPLDPKTFQVYEPGLYSSLVLTWERPVGFPALTGLSLAFSMTYTGEVD
jgi:hypothetical protein